MPTADTEALLLYQQIQRHSWPLVEALRVFRLTEQEAEALFVRLDWLTQYLPGMLSQFQGTT